MRRKSLWDIQSGSKDPDELTRQEAFRFIREAILVAMGSIVGFVTLAALVAMCRGGL